MLHLSIYTVSFLYINVLMYIMCSNLVISSFNCKNVKSSIVEIRNLCKTSDVILLQETWLTARELPLLSQISSQFYARGVSSMDTSSSLLNGRPFGGLAILWRKKLGTSITPVLYDDDRLLGLEIKSLDNSLLLIVNTYLPFCSNENLDVYLDYLGKINSIVESTNSPYHVVMGDFNADLRCKNGNATSHKFGRELVSFCKAENLYISDLNFLNNSNTFTFTSSSNGTISWLDHIITTANSHRLISNISVHYDFISSDHLPLSATLNFSVGQIEQTDDKPALNDVGIHWEKLSENELKQYTDLTKSYLSQNKT